MLDKGKRTENGVTWQVYGMRLLASVAGSTEMSQFQCQAVLSPAPQTNMQIRIITENI